MSRTHSSEAGTAKFTFWDDLILYVTTPITRPVRSSNGPPELPGLAAASVWMASFYTRETMPVEALSSSP